jgi:hypothetical protein
MIKDFSVLLDNTQDAMHPIATYSGTHKYIKDKSRNKTYILDDQLHPMALFIDHGIKVQVEDLDGQCISQMCRGTGSQSWRGGDQRNDWVWVKQGLWRCYGALNGRLPCRLQ